MDQINEFLKNNYSGHAVKGLYGPWEIPEVTKRIVCNDGFSISVQANTFSYCIPHDNKAWPYSKVELGFPSAIDDLIEDFSDEPGTTETVYPYVPIEIVNQLIEKHGGIANN